jgi:hypothetical protein
LNDPDMATLDTLEAWKDLPEWKKFQTKDKYCFDMFFIIKFITNNLNACAMTNPFPMYPTNPFTKDHLHPDDLIYIRRWIGDNDIRPAPVLSVFLSSNELWTVTNELEWRNRCISEFEKTLRYRRLNTLPGGGEISGIWVSKKELSSKLERNIYRYLDTADENILAKLQKEKREVVPDEYYFYSLPGATDMAPAWN